MCIFKVTSLYFRCRVMVEALLQLWGRFGQDIKNSSNFHPAPFIEQFNLRLKQRTLFRPHHQQHKNIKLQFAPTFSVILLKQLRWHILKINILMHVKFKSERVLPPSCQSSIPLLHELSWIPNKGPAPRGSTDLFKTFLLSTLGLFIYFVIQEEGQTGPFFQINSLIRSSRRETSITV